MHVQLLGSYKKDTRQGKQHAGAVRSAVRPDRVLSLDVPSQDGGEGRVGAERRSHLPSAIPPAFKPKRIHLRRILFGGGGGRTIASPSFAPSPNSWFGHQMAVVGDGWQVAQSRHS